MVIDIVFLILMTLAAFKGLRKGFIVALFSILGFIIGIAAALKLSASVAAHLAANGGHSQWWPAISFVLVFIAVAIAVNLLGKLIQKTFEAVALGWANRLAGVLAFALLYCIILSVFLFYAVELHVVAADTTEASIVYAYLQPLGPLVIEGFGKIIPWFRDMFGALDRYFK